MDETKITPRQSLVLQLLKTGPLSRLQIQSTIKGSKVTIFRELRTLIDLGLVISNGVGKSTVYLLSDYNPLLTPPDPQFKSPASISFNFQVFNHLNHLLSPPEIKYLASITKSLTKQLDKLNTTIARKELERFVIELAWKSSQIEGNTYSLLETETLIKLSQEPPGHTKNEAVMILNHKSAFETIFRNRVEFKTLRVSDIHQLHNTLIKDLEVSPGVRTHPVGITGTSYHPLDNKPQITEAIDQLVACINLTNHPLEKALIAGAMIAYIQPFADGNKRTSRMLANAILMAYDYYPLSYRAVSETDYKQAIIHFYEQNSIQPFKKIFLDQYEYALNNYFVTND